MHRKPTRFYRQLHAWWLQQYARFGSLWKAWLPIGKWLRAVHLSRHKWPGGWVNLRGRRATGSTAAASTPQTSSRGGTGPRPPRRRTSALSSAESWTWSVHFVSHLRCVVYTNIYTHTDIYICIYMYVYKYIYMYINACMYIHIIDAQICVCTYIVLLLYFCHHHYSHWWWCCYHFYSGPKSRGGTGPHLRPRRTSALSSAKSWTWFEDIIEIIYATV